MAKKCPPGVFCIQNVSLVGILLVFTLGIAVFMNMNTRTESAKQKVHTSSNMPSNAYGQHSQGTFLPPMFSAVMNPTHTIQMERPVDVLSDPRHPPLKDTASLYGYGEHRRHVIPSMMINQPTQAPRVSQSVHATYSQIGILTRKQGEKILPLMGRMSQIQRNKWQYYTMSDGNQSIRLPVSRNGRSCTNDNGCDEIMNGDTVYVEGYKDAFQATVYENDLPRYLPNVL